MVIAFSGNATVKIANAFILKQKQRPIEFVVFNSPLVFKCSQNMAYPRVARNMLQGACLFVLPNFCTRSHALFPVSREGVGDESGRKMETQVLPPLS